MYRESRAVSGISVPRSENESDFNLTGECTFIRVVPNGMPLCHSHSLYAMVCILNLGTFLRYVRHALLYYRSALFCLGVTDIFSTPNGDIVFIHS